MEKTLIWKAILKQTLLQMLHWYAYIASFGPREFRFTIEIQCKYRRSWSFFTRERRTKQPLKSATQIVCVSIWSLWLSKNAVSLKLCFQYFLKKVAPGISLCLLSAKSRREENQAWEDQNFHGETRLKKALLFHLKRLQIFGSDLVMVNFQPRSLGVDCPARNW